MAVAFEFRMKTSKKVKAFKGRHRRGTKCEPVCARAFFYDDKRPANVAAGSYGKYKLEVGRGSGACQCGGAVCYKASMAVELKRCSFLSLRLTS